MSKLYAITVVLTAFFLTSVGFGLGYLTGRLDAPAWEPVTTEIQYTTFKIKQGFVTVLSDKGDWEMTVEEAEIKELKENGNGG
jgi:hypothetical protein